MLNDEHAPGMPPGACFFGRLSVYTAGIGSIRAAPSNRKTAALAHSQGTLVASE
jgi:hypothetical protein